MTMQKRERQQAGREREPVAGGRPEVQREDVDVDVAARHQHVGAADERGGDDAIGDHVDLPDRRAAEDVALDQHLADHQHCERR